MRDQGVRRLLQAAALSLLVAPWTNARAAQDDLAPCRAIAARARTLSDRGLAAFAADEALAPLLQIPHDLADDPPLVAKAMRLSDGFSDAYGASLQHIDGPVWRAYQAQGTLHCVQDVFFTLAADGSASPLPSPAAYDELCWTSGRDLGTVAGKPALIERDSQDHPLLGEDIEVTPWDSGWRAPCRVALRFSDAFKVTEQFCADPAICRAARPVAPGLAQALARDPHGKTLASVAPPPARVDPAAHGRLLALAEDLQKGTFSENGPIPTFGATPKAEFADFTDGSQSAVIYLDGKGYVAHVGVGGVGWRQIGDYLISIYAVGNGDPRPVASFIVERRLTSLKSATVSTPQPWVNPH